jgi:hypothetical protein
MALVTRAVSDSDFSIQYQSSSLAEFIMVKESDFLQVVKMFTARRCKQSRSIHEPY